MVEGEFGGDGDEGGQFRIQAVDAAEDGLGDFDRGEIAATIAVAKIDGGEVPDVVFGHGACLLMMGRQSPVASGILATGQTPGPMVFGTSVTRQLWGEEGAIGRLYGEGPCS